jgi:hypothetical protein
LWKLRFELKQPEPPGKIELALSRLLAANSLFWLMALVA